MWMGSAYAAMEKLLHTLGKGSRYCLAPLRKKFLQQMVNLFVNVTSHVISIFKGIYMKIEMAKRAYRCLAL